MSKRKASSEFSIILNEEQRLALREVSNNLRPPLRCLIPVLQKILAYDDATLQPPAPKAPKTRAATLYKQLEITATDLDVDFKSHSSHFFYLRDEYLPPSRRLTEPYATIVEHLIESHYVCQRNDESYSRTILDLIILDRLRLLKDDTSHRRLRVYAEVPLEVRSHDEDNNEYIIKGMADWVLAHTRDVNKCSRKAILAIVKAMASETLSKGMPQLLIYMAAIQEERSSHINSNVFGLLSDGKEFFQFALLTQKKKLYRSTILAWAVDQSKILAYIDTILSNATESSPSTTEQRTNNSIIHGYQGYLARHWRFGEELDDESIDNVKERTMGGEEGEEEEEENGPVNVFQINNKVVMEAATKRKSFTEE